MRDDTPATSPAHASAPTAFAVRLEAVGASTPRRARLAVAIWTMGLAVTAWIGLAGHDDRGAAKVVAAPDAALETTVATPTADAIRATAIPTLSRGTVRYISAPVAARDRFGEDGLMGGIVFGDSVPAPKIQADVERDGYRRYHQP